MKEEVARIMKLVAEGKLSPEDAAELIEAIQPAAGSVGPRPESQATTATAPPSDPPTEAQAPRSGGETPKEGSGADDPLKNLFDSFEKLIKEGVEGKDWNRVVDQAKETARRGVDAVRQGLDELRKESAKAGWFGQAANRTIELPLPSMNGRVLRIENAVGNVRIVGGFETGGLIATAEVKGSSSEDAKERADKYDVSIEESDHVVTVKQPDIPGLKVDLVIQVAGAVPVELKVASGSVQVIDTLAGARVQTRTGDVTLKGLRNAVEISSESSDIEVLDSELTTLFLETRAGEVTVKNTTGSINARTASGDVDVEGVHGGAISLESVSGDVRLELDQPVAGTVSVRTVKGDSYVQVPAGSNARLAVSSLSGSIHLPESDRFQRSAQHATATLGDGLGTIDVSAVSGSVTIELTD